MLCDNIKPNLNMERLVIARVHTDIKITNNIKTIFIDRVPYKYIDKPIFSSYAQSYFLSLKMWKIISPSNSMEYTKSCAKKTCRGVDRGCVQHQNPDFGMLKSDL